MRLEVRQAGEKDFRIVCVEAAGREMDLRYSCPHHRAAKRKAERYARTTAGRKLLAERLALLKAKAAAEAATD